MSIVYHSPDYSYDDTSTLQVSKPIEGLSYSINVTMKRYHLFNEIFLDGSRLKFRVWMFIRISAEKAIISIHRKGGRCPIAPFPSIHIDPTYIHLVWKDWDSINYIENSAHNMEILKRWTKDN